MMTRQEKRAATANLNKMLKIFEKYGWTQHEFGNKQRGFCLLGANVVANGQGESDAFAALEACLPPDYTLSICSYNDAKGRSLRQVKALVARALKYVEKQ